MKQLIIIFTIALVSCKHSENMPVRFEEAIPKNTEALNGTPTLTYEMMLEEHDSLVSYIKQVSPIIYFNKEVRGIDFEKLASKLRSQINEKTTMAEYLLILNKTLNSAQDSHTSIAGSWMIPIIKEHYIPNDIYIFMVTIVLH